MFKHILLPTDGSPLSKKSVTAGIEFAKSQGARVTAFFSPEQYEVLAYGEYFPPDLVSRADWEKRSSASAQKILAEVEAQAKAAGVAYQGHFRASLAPWQAIVDAADEKECDLIFMASHGRTGISGLLLGSQAAKVLAHAKMPVLVYK